MRYYKIDEDTIEFAKDIIKFVLPLKYLDKIYCELNISCEVAFVHDTGHQHTSKIYGIGNVNMKLILMYEYFMRNFIVDIIVLDESNLNNNMTSVLSLQ
jgi:hypothetical protein